MKARTWLILILAAASSPPSRKRRDPRKPGSSSMKLPPPTRRCSRHSSTAAIWNAREDGHRRLRDVSRQKWLHGQVRQGISRRDRRDLRAAENRRGLPRAPRARAGKLKVYPLNNYGAIEIGVHRFYQLLPGKPEKLVEVSQFTHVWKKEEGGWKLSRVLSYDHRLTD